MTYKINFHKVSKEQSHKGLIANASFQAKVWVEQEKKDGNSKDWAYKHIAEKMKNKYPELSDEERKDIILRYL